MEEIIPIEVDLERAKQRFLDFIIEAQKKGDIRSEIRPEFLTAVIDKLYEMARNETLINHYPSFMDFRR